MDILAVVEHFHVLVKVAEVNAPALKVDGQFKERKMPANPARTEKDSRSLPAYQERGRYILCFPSLEWVGLCALMCRNFTNRTSKIQHEVYTVAPARKVRKGNHTDCLAKITLPDQSLRALYLVEEPVIENHRDFSSRFLSLQKESFPIPKIFLCHMSLPGSRNHGLFEEQTFRFEWN